MEELVNGQQYYVYTSDIWAELVALASDNTELQEFISYFQEYNGFHVFIGDDNDMWDFLVMLEDCGAAAPTDAVYILSTQSFSGNF